MLKKLHALDKFNDGKVTIDLNFNNSGVTYTYMNFMWDDDAGNLIIGDKDSIHEDVTCIDIDNILDITEVNNDVVEIEMEYGNMTIVLDTDYSLCFKCKEKRPEFIIRAISQNSDEYDIRVCQNCFVKMIEM